MARWAFGQVSLRASSAHLAGAFLHSHGATGSGSCHKPTRLAPSFPLREFVLTSCFWGLLFRVGAMPPSHPDRERIVAGI